MSRFVLGQIFRVAAVIIGVTTLMFVLSRFAGDPASLYSPPSASAEMIEKTAERMGLNDPLLVQYGRALVGPFKLDFGNSYAFQGPVLGTAISRIGSSLVIVFASLAIATLLATSVGTVAALYPTKVRGRLIMVISYITQAIPYFWLPLIMVLILSLKYKILPATGNDGLSSLIIPVTTLGVFGYATMSRLVRGALLDVFSQDYILTARSKGVKPTRILFRHALPAASPPLLSWLGIQFSYMVSSLLVIEPILNRRGIGSLLVQGVKSRDFPLVQVCVVLIAVMVTVVNSGIDLGIRQLDPRIAQKDQK